MNIQKRKTGKKEKDKKTQENNELNMF